ncbi:hypothetical protein P4N68_12145 [Corynebacterium felinum]|uniref:Secreted protein n=1 Tax=Corynebacterium felinum TaxID=131318 RepID=A0ABU2B9R5_9CORY|nr:hypothetical protein [Corynebacterium felinum]MDF5821817.1 hypothetical protein [Corynebacterium felinum]MDR7355374.1 hypothetical protein [Corynebacterium felinum]WJY94726.1 hypothetical protein CFELI_05490 [Corynebacterium felinum]
MNLRRIQTLAMAAVIGLCTLAQPSAMAKEVPMPYPLGGTHTVEFTHNVECFQQKRDGNTIYGAYQIFSVKAVDKDAKTQGGISSLLSGIFPFNSAVVSWRGINTGGTEDVSVRSMGSEIEVKGMRSSFGPVEVNFTVTRSLLPIVFSNSSLPWLSVTHNETIMINPDPATCKPQP